MPQRITAHVRLCVLALMIQHATNMTWAQISDTLESLKAVHCRIENQAIVQTTNPTLAVLAILKNLEISKAKRILNVA
jgi:hypothetical protein